MIQTTNISLIPSDNKPVINVSQFDNVSRVLRFNVFDDADMETPHVFDDGDTVLLNIRKNDNNIVVITGVIVSDIDPETQEVTGQYITFELTEQACACVGSNYGEVSITSGDDEVIGSCNFKLIVERSPLAGGISSQTEIDNLTTQIEDITEQVIGENYYDKQEIDNKFDNLDIPTKTSDLENDSGFITASALPTKTSQLQNDSGFITEDDIPTIPTKTSQLQNDSGFITEDDIPTIPTKTSQLQNDSGFTTIDDDATANDKTWSSKKISDALLLVGAASGPIASFNTALSEPLVSCVVDENATKLTKCGANLCDEEWESGTLNSSGVPIPDASWIRSKNYTPVIGGNSYYVKGTVRTDIHWYDSEKSFIQRITSRQNSIVIAPSTASFCKITTNEAIYNNDVSINYPASNTSYNEYKHVDYNLPLQSMPDTYLGDNNFFADIGDVSLTYKDTIKNYIDTRFQTVQASSNRTISLMRSETLEPIERGDNNDDNAR